MAPSKIGSMPSKPLPCKYTENITVKNSVTMAMPQSAAAILSAAPANATPITIATLPVMMGGSTLSSAALPMRMINRPMQNLDHARADDAHLRDAHAIRAIEGLGTLEALGIIQHHRRDDDRDVTETGTVIHGDAALGNQQRHDGADTAGEQRGGDIELGEDGDQHRGGEHGQHLLNAQADHRRDGRRILRQVAHHFDFFFGDSSSHANAPFPEWNVTSGRGPERLQLQLRWGTTHWVEADSPPQVSQTHAVPDPVQKPAVAFLPTTVHNSSTKLPQDANPV